MPRVAAEPVPDARRTAVAVGPSRLTKAAKALNDERIRALKGFIATDAEHVAMLKAQAEAKDLYKEWDSLSIDRRRSIASALAESIVVGPAVRVRNVYMPERVTVVPRVPSATPSPAYRRSGHSWLTD